MGVGTPNRYLAALNKEQPTKADIFHFPITYIEGEAAMHADLASAGYIWRALKTWAEHYGYPIPMDVLRGDAGSEKRNSDKDVSKGAYVLDESVVMEALSHVYNISPDDRAHAAQAHAQIRAADEARSDYFASINPADQLAASADTEAPVEPRLR